MLRVAKLMLLGSLSLSSGMAAAAPTVRVTGGEIQGIQQGQLSTFLGIPYAKPPVGQLRWRDPQPVSAWTGVRAATQFSPPCYQGKGEPFGPFTKEFIISGQPSEDCLYLNVWAPKASAVKKPVLVFIHGGGFGSGATAIPVYNGAGLARKGVVVVTLNYRLGVFGFLATPELTAESSEHSSGEYGILDAIAALKWVRDNIAQFGGDPGNVTVSGQSAGAAAVSDLIVSPLAKGLFQRAIIQSGPGLGVQMRDLAGAETAGLAVEKTLHAANLSELRRLPAKSVWEAVHSAAPSPGKSGAPQIAMAPNVDGAVIAWDPNIDDRVISNVPTLAGYNSDEAFIFGAPDATVAQFVDYVRSRYGAFSDRFLAAYPHSTNEEARRSMDAIGRDRYMSQLVLWAERRSKFGGGVYLYQFNHPYPGLNPKQFGAFHTAEVPYVFGALSIPNIRFTAEDRAVSDQVQSHWIAFMRDGDPNIPPSHAWPNWVVSPGKVMALGDDPGPRWPVSSKARFDIFKAFVESGGKLSLF